MTSETDNKVEAARFLENAIREATTRQDTTVYLSKPVAEALLSSKEAADQRCDRLAAEVETYRLANVSLKAEYVMLKAERDEAEAKLSALVKDARRYRRLRVLGCAVTDTPQLDAGTVVRFTGLDDLLEADLKYTPSRGEFPAEPAQEVAGLVERFARIIDPEIFKSLEAQAGFPPESVERHQNKRVSEALDKARAIAAFASSPSQGDETVDMRKVVEALGFEPDNHHNAVKCPYCNPNGLTFSEA